MYPQHGKSNLQHNELIKPYYDEKKKYKTIISKNHRHFKAKFLNNLVDMEKQNFKISGGSFIDLKMEIEHLVSSQVISPLRTGPISLIGC